MPQEFRRVPAAQKAVSQITERDIRVSVTGTIIESADQAIILDDGTGRVKVAFDKPQNLKTERLVRIIGRVMPMDGSISSGAQHDAGFEIQGEIVQDMQGLDLDVFKKLQSIKSS